MTVASCFRVSATGLVILGACHKDPPPTRQAVAVNVSPVMRRDVPVVLQATGTVEPIEAVAVAAQVNGMLQRVTFREGDDVQAGTTLFQIDSRPYVGVLNQAEAALARDMAQEISVRQAAVRAESLAAGQYISAEDLEQARAAAAGQAATLRADSSAVNRARLDVERTSVKAPISGRAGALLVKEGNLVVGGGSQALVVINQLAPILVRFAVPATELPGIRRAGSGLPAVAVPVGDTIATQGGSLIFVDNAVDSLTGTILLKARFPNQNHALWPGGLVRVALRVSVEKDALVVPASAVLTGQQGASIFVISDSARASLRHVTVLRSTDSLAILAGGVKPGEQVVTDGQIRLTDGVKVQVVAPDSGTKGDVP